MTTTPGISQRLWPSLLIAACAATACAATAPREVAAQQAEAFNTIIGTQTFNTSYQFTAKPMLVETAEVIRDMGANVIKFELIRDYGRNLRPAPPLAKKPTSLTELARDVPAVQQVLDMPFHHYVLWAHSFACDLDWRNGFAKSQQEKEYRELFDLTAYLLHTYSGTDKTFYLGHWEGDGVLRGTVAKECDARATPEAVQGMIDWLRTRQRAIDDARRTIAHRRVQVWHYTEVNHVALAMEGRPAVTNLVLPKVAVDYVSYSSYDTQADPHRMRQALDFIESKMQPAAGITGKRVFIGEYGFPIESNSPAEQEVRARRVMRLGLDWGCPFVLYWELYNNEVDAHGKQRGFWLIDDHNVRQPVYGTHHRFLAWAERYKTEAVTTTGHVPPDAAFRQAAVAYLDALDAAKQ